MIRSTVDAERRVTVLVLDRPEVKNALDAAHWEQLEARVRAAAEAGSRALVLTGGGSVFCAGADLNGISVTEMGARVETAFRAVREVPVPVIAAVNGPAIGAGMQLAASCDLRVGSTRARFGIPAAAIALPASPGTIRRVVELAGRGAARAVLLGGESLPAERAHALGFVDRVDELDGAVAWAVQIARYSPGILSYFKRQLQVDDPPDGGAYADFLREVSESADFAEAMLARSERRAPVYRDR